MAIVEKAIETLSLPGSIAVVLIILFAALQLLGEFIEAAGKVAPTWLKLRKIWKKRREEAKEHKATLQEVQKLLKDVGEHYDADNIAKRDSWMAWVNNRAEVYDQTIIELTASLNNITEALNNNTKMTQQMFVESSRDRIIDFASKVSSHPVAPVSREEFQRIFKIYDKYENFLAEHDMTNGEVEISMSLIREAYRERTSSHGFIEDSRI